MNRQKSAISGPGRFQWEIGGWFGGVVGGSAWLVPVAVILAFNGQATLALLPAGSCLLMLAVGTVLWQRRDRVRPFPALLAVLALFSIATPLNWIAVSANATTESLVALRWPQWPGITALVTLICPLILVSIYAAEKIFRSSRTSSNPSVDRVR